MLIGCVKETAKIGMNAQHVEVIPCRCVIQSADRILARIESHSRTMLISRQILEAAVAIAQIEIVGIRLPASLSPRARVP